MVGLWIFPYSVVTSLGLGGYLWLSIGRCCCLTSGKFSRMSTVVLGFAGSICKVNGYLSRNRIFTRWMTMGNFLL